MLDLLQAVPANAPASSSAPDHAHERSECISFGVMALKH